MSCYITKTAQFKRAFLLKNSSSLILVEGSMLLSPVVGLCLLVVLATFSTGSLWFMDPVSGFPTLGYNSLLLRFCI